MILLLMISTLDGGTLKMEAVMLTRVTETSNRGRYAAYIRNGQGGGIRIKDDTSTSVFYHKNPHNVSMYEDLRVSFWFKARGMNNNEFFVLEYSSDGGDKLC